MWEVINPGLIRSTKHIFFKAHNDFASHVETKPRCLKVTTPFNVRESERADWSKFWLSF